MASLLLTEVYIINLCITIFQNSDFFEGLNSAILRYSGAPNAEPNTTSLTNPVQFFEGNAVPLTDAAAVSAFTNTSLFTALTQFVAGRTFPRRGRCRPHHQYRQGTVLSTVPHVLNSHATYRIRYLETSRLTMCLSYLLLSQSFSKFLAEQCSRGV